jgi:RNA polymerase sigma factor (sigma-70 family)
MARSMPCPPLLAAADDLPVDAARAPTDLAQALCGQAPRLRRLVHRLLGWRAAADELDDVVQDVLLKAWNGRASFRGEASLATWLTSIALSTSASHARSRARWRRLFGWFDREPAQPLPTADGDTSERTAVAMQRLRHDDREVLVLRYLEQRAIPEIAELLGCTRAAVDARLSRARQRLRAALGASGAEERR